jgi:hypothetical protein
MGGNSGSETIRYVIYTATNKREPAAAAATKKTTPCGCAAGCLCISERNKTSVILLRWQVHK